MNKLARVVILVKLALMGFGYLILSMLQGTFNLLEFNVVSTIVFCLWCWLWISAPVKQKNT